ncbi:hypothetical protein HMI54_008254 [Coelomomyces lativittatus]|nr:hypothetical protein HMI56_003272 [Coelomomyces lativittatus]KAJ1503270.1 hypothetical protein HMI54_008254 [Coelomomyces lativittatus]
MVSTSSNVSFVTMEVTNAAPPPPLVENGQVEKIHLSSSLSPSKEINPSPQLTSSSPPLPWKQKIKYWREDRWTVGLLVAFVFFVDMLFYSALVPILPSIIEVKLKLTSEYSGMLMSAYAAGLLVFSPLIGRISDYYLNRKVPMMVSLLGLLLTSILFIYSTEFWHYLCLRILQGVSAAGSWTVGLALASDAFSTHQLGTIMGIVLGAMHFGYTAGPTIGGLLFDSLGTLALSIFFILMTLFALLFRLFVVDQCTEALKSIPPRSTPKKTMFQLLWSPPICMNGWIILVLATITAGLDAHLSTWLTQEYQLSVSEAGFTFLAISIPGLVLSPLVGYLCDRYSLSKILLIGLSGFSIITPFVGLPKSYPWTVAVLAIFGCFNPIALSPTLPDMGDYIRQVQPESSSQVYSVFNMAFSLGMLLGPLIQGYIYVSVNFFMSLMTFAIVGLLTLVLYGFYIKTSNWISLKSNPTRLSSLNAEVALAEQRRQQLSTSFESRLSA